MQMSHPMVGLGNYCAAGSVYEVNMDKQFWKEFKCPGKTQRGKPFWAWNGKLNPEELRRQIRVFKKMGLGGFFMHSRVGLDTEYLGEDWFECVKACVDEASKQDMEAWLYDEDRWPSGAAGGLVTVNPEFRSKHLVMEIAGSPEELQDTTSVLAAFTAVIDGYAASDVKPYDLQAQKNIEDEKSLITFSIQADEPSPWYNGQTYLDTMNHDAVNKFIEVTHQTYQREIGEHFGNLVPGIFTDEPNYGHKTEIQAPWTKTLPEVFQQRYGYDLMPHLVELFFNLDQKEISQVRYHYYDCITYLFVDAFARQVGEWCEENGVQSTGHVLEEDTPAKQTAVAGSAMRFYEYMQAPGIDVLTEHRRALLTAKQCTSAAHQFGRPNRLSETNGCTGWDLSFEGHKAIGDWQAACGINLRCQHLSWYTMLGQAKRDYPASISYQSPWWNLYDTVEGYFARVHAAMSRGKEVRDLLVIHPLESVWALNSNEKTNQNSIADIDSMLYDLTAFLLGEHIDFDFGDEDILARHSEIKNDGDEAILSVGQAHYKAVVVPPLKTIRSSTLDLLKQFIQSGGSVFFVGAPPQFVDALPSEDAAQTSEIAYSVDSLSRELIDEAGKSCRRLSIAGPEGSELNEVMYLLKEDDEAFYLFVANTGFIPDAWDQDFLTRERGAAFADVRISGLLGEGIPLELDPETGDYFPAKADKGPDGWVIKTDLPRIASRIFLVPKVKDENVSVTASPVYQDVKTETIAPVEWGISLSEPNCLVLDRPVYTINDGGWSGPEEILRVDRAVREVMGIEPRGGRMVQPWARRKTHSASTHVRLMYEFHVDHLPNGALQLAIEQPSEFHIRLNGNPIESEAVCGWWVDKSLQTLPVDPAFLKTGVNRLELSIDYVPEFSGFEIVYLLGDFGTRVDNTDVEVIEKPTKLKLGDWCGRGLNFFAGSACYRQNVPVPTLEKDQKVFVKVEDYRGVAARIHINGIAAGVTAWAPHEVDITDLIHQLESEVFELGIEIIGHRRNSHGPLHINEKWPNWTGPAEFTTGEERWYDGYQLVPTGLMKAPQIVVRAP